MEIFLPLIFHNPHTVRTLVTRMNVIFFLVILTIVFDGGSQGQKDSGLGILLPNPNDKNNKID